MKQQWRPNISARLLGILAALVLSAFAGCAPASAPPTPQAAAVYTVVVPQKVFVTAIPAATATLATAPANTALALLPTPPPLSITITLGAPKQLFHAGKADALGMNGVPDQPLTPIQQPDKSYRLFVVGGEIAGIRGSTGLISTKDFLTFMAVGASPSKAQPVFTPSCRGGDSSSSCKDNLDADYAGADLVFPSSSGKELLMLYQGVSTNIGTTVVGRAFYSVVALATSTDNGETWTRRGAVITGSDPKPTANPKPGANGADQSSAILANGYIYDVYPYFPSRSDQGPSMQVARAPVGSDGAPGTFTKYYDGSFGTQPGLGGLGSQVVPTTAACTRPAQPWLTFSNYLGRYLMVFICEQGWFFSTSTDLVNWDQPTQFYAAPEPMFSTGLETEENVSFVTPGNAGQVIGQTGYVLYAGTPAWGKTPHELWMRPFSFSTTQ